MKNVSKKKKRKLDRPKIDKEGRPCLKCKKIIYCNIPFICKGKVGWKSAEHGCGKEYTQYMFYF